MQHPSSSSKIRSRIINEAKRTILDKLPHGKAGNTGTATRHIVVTDKERPIIKITSPSPEIWPYGVYYNNETIWINGTFNGTGSQVRSITINDPRFTLVEPEDTGPHGFTGTFSFKNSKPIEMSKDTAIIILPLNITVKDYSGNDKKIITFVCVINPDYVEKVDLFRIINLFRVLHEVCQAQKDLQIEIIIHIAVDIVHLTIDILLW